VDPILVLHFYYATECVGPVEKKREREEKLGKFISIVTWFKIEFHKSSAAGKHLHRARWW
jgi:hypothetical protein